MPVNRPGDAFATPAAPTGGSPLGPLLRPESPHWPLLLATAGMSALAMVLFGVPQQAIRTAVGLPIAAALQSVYLVALMVVVVDLVLLLQPSLLALLRDRFPGMHASLW